MLALLIVSCLFALGLTGCGGSQDESGVDENDAQTATQAQEETPIEPSVIIEGEEDVFEPADQDDSATDQQDNAKAGQKDSTKAGKKDSIKASQKESQGSDSDGDGVELPAIPIE